MASKKPLIWGADGRPEEITNADNLDAAINEKDVVVLSNANVGAILIGTPVYKNATSGEMDKARANASGTKNVIGIVIDASVAPAASGSVQTDGMVVATTADWDAVTGQTGGLTPGTEYWLDEASAGGMRTTPPGAGTYLVRIGTAISATEMEVSLVYVGKKA